MTKKNMVVVNKFVRRKEMKLSANVVQGSCWLKMAKDVTLVSGIIVYFSFIKQIAS